MSLITTSVISNALKETLDQVWTDQSKGTLQWESLGFKVTNTTDNFVDDVEYAGLGLAVVKPEGQQIAVDSIQQGYPTRYWSLTYALGFVVSEEAIADNKYDKAIDQAGQLSRSMKLTQEYLAANVFINSFSSSYVGGDGVSLCSASHKLPKGGTYSNQFSTAMSFSETAVETMVVNLSKLPSSNGLIVGGYNLKHVVVPKELMFRAARVLKSDLQNDTANNAINVLKKDFSIGYVSNAYLTSSTNWWGVTDADNGLRWIWRQKPRFNTHNTEDNMTMRANANMRILGPGWSNPRGVYGSNI